MQNPIYTFTEPATAECPLPLGPDNAPIVEISSPADGAVFKQSQTMSITGTTRQLQTINEFTVSIDSIPVTGVTLSGFSFTGSKNLSTLAIGNHTLTITAKDNYGKIGSKSVTFKVEADEVSIVPPPNNVRGVRDKS